MNIAAYCRVSTDKEEQLDSLAHQKEFFSSFAAQNGHHLVEVYADEGISGTSLKKRMEFQRLLKDANDGRFQMVIVKDISRFARNTVDFLQSIRTLKALGINTLFLTANMESMGESEFVLTVFSALAQEESMNLSKRVKFGKKINAQKGRVPPRIFGYDRVDNFTLIINETEAEVVRKIYRLYLNEGLGCRAISLTLNQAGDKTKFDCEWSPRGVRRILSNPIYSGEYVNNKYEIQNCLDGKQIRLPPDQQFHHDRPEWAIVSRQDFVSAQALLHERREQYAPASERPKGRQSDKHVFSTLIQCEHCGRSFYQKRYTYANTRVYWKCQTNDRLTSKVCDNRVTITENELLSAIKDYLFSVLRNQDTFVQSILRELEESLNETEKRDDRIELLKKLKRLEIKRERYQEMYAAEVLTMEQLKQRIDYISKETEVLKQKLMPPFGEEDEKTARLDREQRWTAEIEGFLSLTNVTNGDLRSLIHRITVNREGKITVYLRTSLAV